MPIYEQFIPGQWVDTIDVNDFVNLNKKPFLKEPFFLTNSENEQIQDIYNQIRNTLAKEKGEIDLSFPSFEKEEIPWFHGDFSHNPLKRKVGFSENFNDMKQYYGIPSGTFRNESRKTTYQLFDEVATSDIHKMIKMNLFEHAPTTYSPSFVHPDVRIVALYGTKKLIKEKRWALKTLEKHLQTHEWMQRRISIHREIEAIKQFDKFTQKQGFDLSEPASSAEEAVLFLYLTIAGVMMENPSIPFSLSQIIPFIDVYLEHDLQNGIINEEKAQEIMDDFYLKLSFIRFSLSPGLAKLTMSEPFFLGETFDGESVTKASYRFLYSLRKFRLFPFSIRILWNENIPAPFEAFIQDLIDEEIPISFYFSESYQRNDALSFYASGQSGIPSEDLLFDAGTCNLEKLLYLSLNGGKDVEHNSNLMPITQPFRKNELNYDEVISKFKDYLSYVLSSYVELMNIVLYINEVHNNHSFRSSLMSYLLHYHVQFGFSHVEKTLLLLSSVYDETAEVKRDKKGWITAIVPSEDSMPNEMILTLLTELIRSEMGKIPIYKSGKPTIKFYPHLYNSTFTESEVNSLHTIPPEITPVVFHASVHLPKTNSISAFLKENFDKGFRELHVYSNEKWKLINGILYVENEE